MLKARPGFLCGSLRNLKKNMKKPNFTKVTQGRRNNHKDIERLEEEGLGVGILSLVVFALVLWLTIWYQDVLLRFSSLGYLGLLVSNFLASSAVFLPVPTLLASFVGGNILNPILVGLFSGIGSALGDFVAFLFGFGARRVVNKVFKKEVWLGQFEHWLKRNAFAAVFVLSFIPNPFFDGVGILAGAANVKPKEFLIATVLGRVLRNILLALSGQKILS